MAEKWNFAWLVSTLTLEERQELLRKINASSKLSSEPLYVEADKNPPAFIIDTVYAVLPWYKRVLYFLMGILKHRPPKTVLFESEITALGKKIEKKYPGLYDYKTAYLLPAFYQHFIKLRDAAAFFFTALDASVSKDREAFYAFLGSVEMTNIYRRLLTETKPEIIMRNNPDGGEREWRQTALRLLEDITAGVSKDQRSAMYSSARCLFCLKELSSFPFDRFMKIFTKGPGTGRYSCPVSSLMDLLVPLNNILWSLQKVPGKLLLESLFVFLLQKRAGEPGFNIDSEINKLLIRAEESLTAIREFNRLIPLTWILRCSSKDMTLLPREISGGEDWFVVFKEYWKKLIERQFQDYLKEYRQKELIRSFNEILKGEDFIPIENTRTVSNPEGIPVRGVFAVSFLHAFYRIVLIPDIYKVLYLLLIGGDFRRDEERMEFSSAYNTLMALDEETKTFELKVSLTGEYGRNYLQAKNDIVSLAVKQRRMQEVINKAEEDVGKILEQTGGALVSMANIMSSILVKNRNARLDTLHNTESLSLRDSKFTSDVQIAADYFRAVLSLLKEIEAMESGR